MEGKKPLDPRDFKLLVRPSALSKSHGSFCARGCAIRKSCAPRITNKMEKEKEIKSEEKQAKAEVERKKASKERKRKEAQKEEREKMLVLVSNFTEDQLDRYEMFRRATFPKAAVKRAMQNTMAEYSSSSSASSSIGVGQNVVIAMAGIAKVFAGEVCEAALDYQRELGESGAIKPKHLREAARRIRERPLAGGAQNHGAGGQSCVVMPRAKRKKLFN